MSASDSLEAITTLEAWLNKGYLVSKYDLLAEKSRSDKDSDRSVPANKEDRRRRHALAAGLEPVALGMLALAQTDAMAKHCRVVEIDRSTKFPLGNVIRPPSSMVLLLNVLTPSPGGIQAKECKEFEPNSMIGLKGAFVQVGETCAGDQMTQIGLILSARNSSPQTMNGQDFTVVMVDLLGNVNNRTTSPRFAKDGYMHYSLGLRTLDEIDDTHSWHCGLDEAMGLPRAADYLANALPRLGAYFTFLAVSLASRDGQ